MPILFNPEDRQYYAFTRGGTSNSQFNIYMMKSSDGVHFSQAGPGVFASLVPEWSFYDAHIAVDRSQNPPKYIMTMESS
jgi:hypothetical protein